MEFFIGWAAVTKVTLVQLRGGKKSQNHYSWNQGSYSCGIKKDTISQNTLHGLFQDTPMNSGALPSSHMESAPAAQGWAITQHQAIEV